MDIKLFDKRYVYLEWSDVLEGKDCILAKTYQDLKDFVNSGNEGRIFKVNKGNEKPFTNGCSECDFCYYDLDLKLFPDKVIKSLDEQEFLTNAKRYGYSPDLIKAIRRSFQETREAMEKGVFPFADSTIESLYQKFLAENQPFIPRHFVPRH